MTILETVDLRKRFGDFFALNGVNLKVQRGPDPWLHWPQRGGENHHHAYPLGAA